MYVCIFVATEIGTAVKNKNKIKFNLKNHNELKKVGVCLEKYIIYIIYKFKIAKL